MKQVLAILFALLAFTANAQRKIDSVTLAKPVMNKANVPVKMIKTVPAPAPAPAPRSQTTPKTKPTGTQTTLTDADYFLAGAIIKISTGNDNKEPTTSTASFYVRPRKTNGVVAYKLEEYANEIQANQTTNLRLDRAATLTAAQNTLQHFKQNGFSVLVAYCNKNFCTDAWNISSITVTLEFKDASGNPAPGGYSSKTISFPVSSATLGFVPGCNPFWITDGKMCGHSDQKQKLLLKTDEYFNPLPAALLGWHNDDVN